MPWDGARTYRGRMPGGAAEVVRVVVVGAVLVLLLRAARVAWARRQLALAVWGAIRLRHVAGSLALMVVVLGIALLLLSVVPVSGLGLGSLVGLEGNAVFAPIDGALDAPPPGVGTPVADDGFPWLQALGVTTFLGALVLLFPHLAHVEETVFRTGWEDYTSFRQVMSALRFGLAHLVMLIPLAAALAVAVAGFAYGRIYRHAYERAARPRRVVPPRRLWVAEDEQGITRLVMGPPSPVDVVDRAAARRQAVFAAAVWHATFNSTVAVLIWVGYLLSR